MTPHCRRSLRNAVSALKASATRLQRAAMSPSLSASTVALIEAERWLLLSRIRELERLLADGDSVESEDTHV